MTHRKNTILYQKAKIMRFQTRYLFLIFSSVVFLLAAGLQPGGSSTSWIMARNPRNHRCLMRFRCNNPISQIRLLGMSDGTLSTTNTTWESNSSSLQTSLRLRGLETSFYTISHYLVALQAAIDALLFGQRLLTHTRLPYYLLLYTVYDLLRTAELRNRLDSSTFKILGLSSALSVLWLLYSVGLSPPPMILAAQSLLATQRFGVSFPKINFLTVFSDPLPVLYLASIVPSFLSARAEMAPAIPLLVGTLIALHSAALVGSRRLSSETYKKLNAMMVMFHAGAAVAHCSQLRLCFAIPMMLGLLKGFSVPAASVVHVTTIREK